MTSTADPGCITINADFIARQGDLDKAHIRTLAGVVRDGRMLDAVLLWQDPEARSNGFVLLDGRYRLSAYKTAGWTEAIPAKIVECKCSRQEALLLAVGANSKDRKGLTPVEKANYAWRLVRDPACDFSKAQLTRATGISDRTIARMRARWRELQQEEGREVTGSWYRDQRDDDVITDAFELSEAQRRRAAKEVGGQLRDVLDWRKGNPALRDREVRYEAIAFAIGEQDLKGLFEWHYGGEDEADDWGSIDVQTVSFVDEKDAVDEDEGDDARF